MISSHIHTHIAPTDAHFLGGICVFVSDGFQPGRLGAQFFTLGRNAVSFPELLAAGCVAPTVS
jgi:hypothetical protein